MQELLERLYPYIGEMMVALISLIIAAIKKRTDLNKINKKIDNMLIGRVPSDLRESISKAIQDRQNGTRN